MKKRRRSVAVGFVPVSVLARLVLTARKITETKRTEKTNEKDETNKSTSTKTNPFSLHVHDDDKCLPDLLAMHYRSTDYFHSSSPC